MMAMPMRTCPALHGWRRYGKRSPARRAIPQTTILSESPLFSRCFRCSRKRHAEQANRFPDTLVSGDKGIRGGYPEEIFEEEKGEEGSFCRSEEARQKDRCEEGREETGREEGCQKVSEEICEGESQQAGICAEGQASESASRGSRNQAGRGKTRGAEGETSSDRKARTRGGAGCVARKHLLHHDRHCLSERSAAYRPRL